MTLVDVCGICGTMFGEDEEHCRRCGADRADAVKRQMRDLCYTCTGEGPEEDEIARIVRPIFAPRWGKVQWYEGEGAEGTEGEEDAKGGSEGDVDGASGDADR